MQEIQTSREAMLICNILLALVAHILTATQANEVAKKHNLHALSHKPLAEKRTAIESHVCTISCNQHVTMFKPMKKNQKSIQHQCSIKVKEIKNYLKVGKKSKGKPGPARVVRNHKYYIQENNRFPPSPPSKCLMHKIVSSV